IAVVGTLLDNQINNVIWIDKEFNGGRISCYQEVPSNTKVQLFKKFFNSCKSFGKVDDFDYLDCEKGCPLKIVFVALKKVTENLKSKVSCIKDLVCSITKCEEGYKFNLENSNNLTAQIVILATGSHPKNHFIKNFNGKILNLDIALCPSLLQNYV